MKELKYNFKKNTGITLVSLVVTIIILIILAGVSINLTLGEEGIFTMAKRAKENTELAQIEEQEKLNALYTELELNSEGEGGTGGNSYDAIEKLLEFKKAIADAIESAGGIKPEITDESTTFADAIKGIVAEVTKDADATAADIAEGKKAYVKGNLVVGNAKNTITHEQVMKYMLGDLTLVASNGVGAQSSSLTVPTGTTSGYLVVCANGFTMPSISISGSGIVSQSLVDTWQASQGSYKANHIINVYYCQFKEEGTITASMSVGGDNYATSIAIFSGNINNLKKYVSNGTGSTNASVQIPKGMTKGYMIICANGFSVPSLSISGEGIITESLVGTWQASQGSSKANHVIRVYHCIFQEEETITASMSVSGNNYATSIALLAE